MDELIRQAGEMVEDEMTDKKSWPAEHAEELSKLAELKGIVHQDGKMTQMTRRRRMHINAQRRSSGNS